MKFLKNRIPTYIEEYKIPDFVIMDMMAGPIISIERILSTPNSHAILSGAPRLGKKTLTKLTSWLMGLTTLEILIGDKDSFDQFLPLSKIVLETVFQMIYHTAFMLVVLLTWRLPIWKKSTH